MMSGKHEIYIATVALEKNRWGSKEPSFAVSDWLERFAADGFDGVELWENHFISAVPDEQVRLEQAAPLAVFNSYAGFDDDSAESRARAADAIRRLKAGGVKYNFGHDAEKTEEYRRNLLEWTKDLPADCVLLCECHQGTVLETVEASKAVFDGLDPDRFGIIVHCSGEGGSTEWFEEFGARIKHVHVQLRNPDQYPAKPDGRAALRSSLAEITGQGFKGSFAMEFTRGIGREEDIEVLYENACSDMREIRAALSVLQEMAERDQC